ncbi:hypothetical protein C8R45DRAFT_1213304 [Mycena sanguinolenta]|nr:hypothetical protein C8R45DRAFT_1213304 [Mycena sanguinolenta]
MARQIFQFFTLASFVLVQLSSTAAAPAPDTFVTLVDPIGFEPVPIPASVVGVDAQGHTTFAYAITATTVADLATATLVEHATIVAGTNYFSIKDVITGPGGALTLAAACTPQNGGGAVCDVANQGVTSELTVPAASMGTLVLDIPSTPTGKTSSASRSARALNSGGVVGLVGITLGLAYQLI